MNLDMPYLISEKLKEIEQKEHIKVLYAAESGSRSWKVSAPDSDYDVRFIYMRAPQEYLRLDKVSDVLEFPIADNLDISGWDLFKALGLLKKSNPRLFEWFNSPIVYSDASFANRFKPIMYNYFSQKSIMSHYIHTAKYQRDHFLQGNSVKLKKYLYALHPIMAAQWVFEHKSPPPIIFRELMDSVLTSDIYSSVEELLYKKINFPEQSVIERVPIVDDYINHSINSLEKQICTIAENNALYWEELNDFFLTELSYIDKMNL